MATTRISTRKTAIKKPARSGTVKRPAKKTVSRSAPKKARSRPAPKKARRTKVLCISHKEDADGISSAALVRQAFGGDTALVDYPGQMDALREAASDAKLKSLYVCDLGLSKKTQDEFLDIMAGLRKKKVAVTYIDHHDIDPAVIASLKKIKVRIIHDVNECTAVLVHDAFGRKLDDHASFVAACAAITDYMEDRPLGSRLLRMYDRQFTMISATVLTYCINGHQRESEYLQGMVGDLAASKFPHQMEDSFESARTQVAKLSEMIAKVKAGMKKMRNLAYMEVVDAGAGGAVNFVMGLSGKDVGVAYKERVDHGIYAVSVRGSQDCKVHLGRIVNALSTELGGSGGGHDRACGAVVPKPKIRQFVRELNKKIG